MGNREKENIDQLKSLLIKEIGRVVKYSGDCRFVSKKVFEKTGRKVSESTIKRFFNLVKVDCKPSHYTLDTFSQFLEFESWDDFYENNLKFERGESATGTGKWDDFKINVDKISDFSLKAIMTRTGRYGDAIISRKFARQKIDEFNSSDKVCTAFIAPGGYGKSVLAAGLLESLREDPAYKNDIICLIDCSLLISLIQSDLNIKSYLNQLISYDPDRSLKHYFKKEEIKGRIFFIFDGIDHFSFVNRKRELFFQNIVKVMSANYNSTLFKFILLIQPSSWRYMVHYLNEFNPEFSNFWFDVHFKGNNTELTNIPQLTEKEVNEILETSGSKLSWESLEVNMPDIANIIQIPYFLKLLISLSGERRQLSDVALLNEFIQQNIFNHIYSDKFLKLLNRFIGLTKFGLEGASVKKSDLLADRKLEMAYDDLVLKEVFYEFTLKSKYLSLTTYVRFTHDLLFQFLNVNSWLRRHDLSVSTIKKITEYYKNAPDIRLEVLKWLVKIIFENRDMELMTRIHTLLHPVFADIEKNGYENLHELTDTIALEVRKRPKLMAGVVDEWAKSPIARHYYFEKFKDMDFLNLGYADYVASYIKYESSAEAYLSSYYLQFYSAFLKKDKDQAVLAYKELGKINPRELKKSYNIGNYYFSRIVFNHFFADPETPALDNEILEALYEAEGKDTPDTMPYLHLSLIDACNLCEKQHEIIELVNRTLNTYYLYMKHLNYRLFEMCMSFYAEALAVEGHLDEAREVFDAIGLENLTVNSKYYILTRYYLSLGCFYNLAGEGKKSLKAYQKSERIANHLQYWHFSEKAHNLKELVSL